MIGASGQIAVDSSGTYNLNATLTIAWRQEYEPGGSYSDIIIETSIVRSATPDYSLGGTWYTGATGSITVNGTAAISWELNSDSGGWTSPGDVGWQKTGTVRVEHTDSIDVEIAFSGMSWFNYSYRASTFSLAAKSETVTLEAVLQPYTLTVSAGSNTSVTVTRDGTALTSGADIYAGDVLKITATASAGYWLRTLTVNGESFSSGGTVTVAGDVTVVAAAQVLTYRLTVTADTGAQVTVTRTSSPTGGGTTGVLASGAYIYYNDVLRVTATVRDGYELTSFTFNGISQPLGVTITIRVPGFVQLVASSKALGVIYIHNGQEWLRYQVYIHDGSGWNLYAPYVYGGQEWSLIG